MKRILITPNPYRDKSFQYALEAEMVLKEAGIDTRICLPFGVDRNLDYPKQIQFFNLENAMKKAELLICFGGDGTILHAAKLASENDLPILGVNLGKVGFMAELEVSELQQLRRLAEDDFRTELRMMMEVSVERNGKQIYYDTALNDAVITKGAVARVVQMNVQCDHVDACDISGDGVIISTPTGSTAYSMAAGGPIVEPTARNLIITPICAHALQAKSIVLSDQRVVTVRIGRIGRKNAYLSADGGKAFRLEANDVVTVQAAKRGIQLVRLKNTSFYERINQKLRVR